ncbi:hypothetical protein THAOC_28683 [Thalassiosira oceanica]|uniref:SprT-like domain-containing protein n=1 Tax=Thalassiosira oceanica TaxID=159749 RepID=K0RII5_THAOC|nr:hypothetical protein THAOC_28683 [Thalassiosira oceanica]|eukprot:EJK52084.1 hypothetical protein THAOC_28683 [Thalassiosira oceanica]
MPSANLARRVKALAAAEDEIDLTHLRERFDKQALKYGGLWRSMASTLDKENASNPNVSTGQSSDLLQTIESKKAIIEIHDEDEDASIYELNREERDLLDTDDEEETERRGPERPSDHSLGTDDEEETERRGPNAAVDVGDESSSDDESVVVVKGKTPKKKRNRILDSDDDIDVGEDADEASENDSFVASEKSIDFEDDASSIADELIFNKRRSTRTRKPLYSFELTDDDASNKNEEEWIELSSDEEEDYDGREPEFVILSDSSSDDGSTSSDDDDSDSNDSVLNHRGGGTVPTADSYRIPRRKPNHRRAPTANFARDRDALTRSTFKEFNERVFGGRLSSVEVTWNNKLQTTAGLCRMKGRMGDENSHTRVASIDLSMKVIDDIDRLRSTLLHELCHAAAWVIDANVKPPHGKVFKKWSAIAMRRTNVEQVQRGHQTAFEECRHKQALLRSVQKQINPDRGPSKGRTGRGQRIHAQEGPKNHEIPAFVKSNSKSVRERLARERSCSAKDIGLAAVSKECGRLWQIKKKNEAGNQKNADCVALDLNSLALD